MAVYFVRAGRYMKVGYSKNPIARSTTVTLAGKRPADLPKGAETTLLGWIPGDTFREMEVLARFKDRHVAGEWFVIDDAEVRELIWSDPSGVDVQRMSAMAVFAAFNHPEVTRDDIAAAGIPIEAVPLSRPFTLHGDVA